jgi:hypothetical protein
VTWPVAYSRLLPIIAPGDSVNEVTHAVLGPPAHCAWAMALMFSIATRKRNAPTVFMLMWNSPRSRKTV